jgi:YbbR domain-containing protein
VETNPIDLSGLSDDIDIRATLNLPEGVELVGEESVLVRLSIAAREGTLPITFPLVVVGLPPELEATFAPDTVDVLLAGPLPILNNLNPAGIRVAVNLTGMEVGSFQVEPVVDLLPNQVRVVYILPETVEVTISEAPTPTPTSEITDLEANLENISTETPQATPSPTVTPSPTLTATSTPSPTNTPTPQQ